MALVHLIGLAFEQRALREEHLVRDAERGQIVADQVHHHRHGLGAHFWQPSRFFHAQEPLAVFLRERFAHRLQVFARIKPLRDLADVFAQSLAIAQECRAREHVHLPAAIVDVIFARGLVAGEIEEIGERIAKDGAARMADMDRTGRVRGDVLDIHGFARANIATAVIIALLKYGAQDGGPEFGL